jgi:hypothetical protein
MLFIGTLIGQIFLMIIGDNTGRRKSLLTGFLITIIGLSFILFHTNLYLAGLGLLLYGAGLRVIYCISFFYII